METEEIEIGKIVFSRGMMEYVYPITNGAVKFGKVSINGKRPLAYKIEVSKTNADRYKTYVDNVKRLAEEALIKDSGIVSYNFTYTGIVVSGYKYLLV